MMRDGEEYYERTTIMHKHANYILIWKTMKVPGIQMLLTLFII